MVKITSYPSKPITTNNSGDVIQQSKVYQFFVVLRIVSAETARAKKQMKIILFIN